MFFWVVVFLLGIVGAAADVSLSRWSEFHSLYRWVVTAVLFLVFMTGFGVCMKFGSARGYSMTAVVLVVLLSNIAAVAIWDFVVGGARFTLIQWAGMILALAAFACFELGRE